MGQGGDMSCRHARVGARFRFIPLLGLCLLPWLAMADPLLLQKARESLLLDIALAGDRLVAVGERGHVLLSDDRGEHWSLAPTPDDRLLTAVFFINEQRGWAVGHEALVLVTDDGGQHWQVQHDQWDAAARGEPVSPLLDIWFADTNTGWAVGAFGLVLHTTDGGAHWQDWTDRVDNPDGLHINAVSGEPGGALLMAGERGLLMRSDDQGLHWQQRASGYDGSLFGIQRFENHWLVFGLRGHVYASTDAEHWQRVGLPLAQTLFAGAVADGQIFLAGQGGTVLAASADFQFRVLQKEQGNHLTAVLPDGRQLWMTGQGGLHQLALPEAQP